MRLRSDARPRSRADAPVAMITERVLYSASDVFTTNGLAKRSTDATWPRRISAPKRSDWARISAISSGPMMPSRCPGQFSTRVVSINWPPASAGRPRATPRAAGPRAPPQPSRDVLVDDLLQRVLVGEPHDLLHDLAALEQQQRWNAADAELERGVGVL